MAKIFHRLVNMATALILGICLSYAAYGLLDTVAVLQRPTALAREMERYRPDKEKEGEKEEDGVEEGSREEAGNGALEELIAVNPDVAGWVTIDGTHIDYPVLQGKDNFEYLNKDIHGEDAASGSIFLDYENNRDFTDFYSILMGHHMQGGRMFGDVAHFAEEDFFREHTTGTLYLNDRTLSLTTVAFLRADAYDQILYRVNVDTEEGKKELLDHIRDTAVFQRGEPLGEAGQYLALSTCSGEYTNARCLLILKVSGEKPEA